MPDVPQAQAGPVWAPDGNSVAFAGLSADADAIHVFDLKTRHVSTLPGSDKLFAPRWSPDGARIVFAQASTSGGSLLPTLTTPSTIAMVVVATGQISRISK